jgi:zinc transporter ZupT
LTSFSTFLLLFLVATAASAAAGVWLPGTFATSRRIVPASGGVLVLIALFWIIPELAATVGWAVALSLLAGALGAVFVVDRYVHPVCPACAHSHDHDACTTRLHGFAGPLLAGMAVHNLFDGWMLAHGYLHAGEGGNAVTAAVLLHKLPECVAFGVILAASLPSRRTALLLAIATQISALVGASLEPATTALGVHWISGLLAIGCASFLYLGVHALHGAWKRKGAEPARAG